MASTSRILGIDPGFDRMGFGVVDVSSAKTTWVTHGCIQTDARQGFAERLQILRDGLIKIIKDYSPAGAVVEQLFFQTNAKTAMKVGMARGVILLALADANVSCVEITPQQLKQGITGWGGADKKQVQEMVKRLLCLKAVPKPDDAADALALAIVGAPLVYRLK